MFTTPEARPITNAQYERAKQIELALRWLKTGRTWLDPNAVMHVTPWTPPTLPK